MAASFSSSKGAFFLKLSLKKAECSISEADSMSKWCLLSNQVLTLLYSFWIFLISSLWMWYFFLILMISILRDSEILSLWQWAPTSRSLFLQDCIELFLFWGKPESSMLSWRLTPFSMASWRERSRRRHSATPKFSFSRASSRAYLGIYGFWDWWVIWKLAPFWMRTWTVCSWPWAAAIRSGV